ncbi:uncharacterized protein LOC103487576 isoform X1 [Cucumis melo]|uniref:Glutaredoxin-like protein n=1 Tax=Cucumis melo TaxID=3656 RepID=A0ABM3L0D8_CUCME|nr:uncharacterized protein LOC103487576 isoform X1 [Cucumis melo]
MISTTAARIGRPSSSPLSLLLKPHTSRPILTPSASFSSSLPSRKLILYSKPGCCLCDGLKEKLHAAFLLSGPDSLHDVHLQVRDITTNPEWERAYQYEIPVLAKVRSDGSEVGSIHSFLLILISTTRYFVFGGYCLFGKGVCLFQIYGALLCAPI